MAAYTWVTWDAGCITLEHEGWEANLPRAAVDTPKQVLMKQAMIERERRIPDKRCTILKFVPNNPSPTSTIQHILSTIQIYYLPSNIYYLPESANIYQQLPSNIYHLSKSANMYPKPTNITSPIYQDLDLPLLARRTEAISGVNSEGRKGRRATSCSCT